MGEHINTPNVLSTYLVTTTGKREHMKAFGKGQFNNLVHFNETILYMHIVFVCHTRWIIFNDIIRYKAYKEFHKIFNMLLCKWYNEQKMGLINMKLFNIIGAFTFLLTIEPSSNANLVGTNRQGNRFEANETSVETEYDTYSNDGYISLESSSVSITPFPGGGGSSGSSSDRKVSAGDLSKNKVEDCNSYNGLTIGNFRSDSWRGSNLIGRYMDINIASIKKVTGVYSHFGSYFDYNILKSGAAYSTIEDSNEYTDTKTESFSFSMSVSNYVEAKLEAKADIDVISASVSFGTKIGATYSYGCTYTRSTTETYKWTNYFSISSSTADYCPEGYSLSIGKQGTYYVVEGDYQETSVWWWGDYPTQGTSRQYFKSVIANPTNFNYCYVYKAKSDSDSDYYNTK